MRFQFFFLMGTVKQKMKTFVSQKIEAFAGRGYGRRVMKNLNEAGGGTASQSLKNYVTTGMSLGFGHPRMFVSNLGAQPTVHQSTVLMVPRRCGRYTFLGTSIGLAQREY